MPDHVVYDFYNRMRIIMINPIEIKLQTCRGEIAMRETSMSIGLREIFEERN